MLKFLRFFILSSLFFILLSVMMMQQSYALSCAAGSIPDGYFTCRPIPHTGVDPTYYLQSMRGFIPTIGMPPGFNPNPVVFDGARYSTVPFQLDRYYNSNRYVLPALPGGGMYLR